MKLPALALFERALRLETRSAAMCGSRTGLLIVILFVLFQIQKVATLGWYGAPGLRFLQQMVWVNLLFITLAGLSYFASAITEEKEEMMLGLLRMTDLNPVAILLGKSTSRLVGAVLLLLVQVPFILLAVTLGGVSLLQIAAAYAALLAYLFLLCNLALLCSVVFRNTTTAAAATLFLLLLFFFGPRLASAIERSIASAHHLNPDRGDLPVLTAIIDFWKRTTPPYRLGTIFQTGFNSSIAGLQVISNVILGVLSFLLAWLVFDPCTREEKESAPVRFRLRLRKTRRAAIPPYLTGTRAITWKDFTFFGGGKAGLLARIFAVGVVILLCNAIALYNHVPLDAEFEAGTFIWVSLGAAALWLAIEASRIFRDEVRWKTLSSLVTLPMSIGQLAYCKAAAALLGTLPLLLYAAVGILIVPNKVGEFITALLHESMAFDFLSLAILQYILFLHLIAYLSLVLKRGALPLAFAIQYIGGSFVFGFLSVVMLTLGPRSNTSIVGVAAFICIVLIAALHGAVRVRLARVAARE